MGNHKRGRPRKKDNILRRYWRSQKRKAKKRNSRNKGWAFVIAILLLILVVAFIVLPLMMMVAVLRLQWQIPALSVSMEGPSAVNVTLTFKVRNPADNPALPTIDLVGRISLNDHLLFHGEARSLGTLNPGDTATVKFTTVVDMLVLASLFGALVAYLAGQPVTLYAYFMVSIEFMGVPLTIDQEIVHTFELF